MVDGQTDEPNESVRPVFSRDSTKRDESMPWIASVLSLFPSKDAVDRREVIRQFLMVDNKDVDVRMVDPLGCPKHQP